MGATCGSALASQIEFAHALFPLFPMEFGGQLMSADEADQLCSCFDWRRPPWVCDTGDNYVISKVPLARGAPAWSCPSVSIWWRHLARC
jgi:hypothetical protein